VEETRIFVTKLYYDSLLSIGKFGGENGQKWGIFSPNFIITAIFWIMGFNPDVARDRGSFWAWFDFTKVYYY